MGEISGLGQCFALRETKNRVFGRLASLRILAMPLGVAVVRA